MWGSEIHVDVLCVAVTHCHSLNDWLVIQWIFPLSIVPHNFYMSNCDQIRNCNNRQEMNFGGEINIPIQLLMPGWAQWLTYSNADRNKGSMGQMCIINCWALWLLTFDLSSYWHTTGWEAAGTGLQPGQVIQKVNGNNVNNSGYQEVLEHFSAKHTHLEPPKAVRRPPTQTVFSWCPAGFYSLYVSLWLSTSWALYLYDTLH